MSTAIAQNCHLDLNKKYFLFKFTTKSLNPLPILLSYRCNSASGRE